MRKILIKLTTFLLLFIIIITLCNIFLVFSLKKSISLKIPPERSILVIGDSHTELSINDEILSNSYNVSSSGTSYFYSYVKLRELIAVNKKIKKVIISYDYNNVTAKKDRWFKDKKYINKKLHAYLFMMKLEDYSDLMIANPTATVMATINAIIYSGKMLFRGKSIIDQYEIGGYKIHNVEKLNMAIESFKMKDSNYQFEQIEYSMYELDYLMKIYDLTEENNIELILIRTPTYYLYNSDLADEYINYYYKFKKEKLPNAIFIDHSDYYLPNNAYADLEHLNTYGAKLYSEYLSINGFN